MPMTSQQCWSVLSQTAQDDSFRPLEENESRVHFRLQSSRIAWDPQPAKDKSAFAQKSSRFPGAGTLAKEEDPEGRQPRELQNITNSNKRQAPEFGQRRAQLSLLEFAKTWRPAGLFFPEKMTSLEVLDMYFVSLHVLLSILVPNGS